LEDVATELIELHKQLGEDRAAEHRARSQFWNQCPPDISVAARDREVEMATADLHAIVLTDEANLRALQAEYDYLTWKVEHGYGG
jgi:hypothetical protein